MVARYRLTRARVVVGVNAGVILAIGLSLLVPLALSLLYGDGSWRSFLIPAAVMIPLGAAGMGATRITSRQAARYVLDRDVYLAVTLAWILAAVLGGFRSSSKEPLTASWTRPSRR